MPGALRTLTLALAAACNVGLYQGPDRPDDPNVLGPPPPADFQCDRGERRVEAKGPKDTRIVHVLGNGEVLCSTEDRNQDGKVDTWNLHEHGQVVEQAVDTDYNGTLETRMRKGKPWIPPSVARDGG